MKKFLAISLILTVIVESRTMQKPRKLTKSPARVERFKEIATSYDDGIVDLLNDLTPQERIFIYYIMRAGLPGNRIAADQSHRYAVAITELFEEIFENQASLEGMPFDQKEFMEDVKTYLVYLWSNHGPYFIKEHADEKRTPERIGLKVLTRENLRHILLAMGKDADQLLELYGPVIFDQSFESTMSVPDSIEESGCNIFARGITEEDYGAIPAEKRAFVNAFFELEEKDGKRVVKVRRYRIGDKYSDELEVAYHWLEKAYGVAKRFPESFDEHVVKSLEHLLEFVKTGDEDYFKAHSREWLKTKSRVDYCFGFIEVYQDPKGFVGEFQAEATIKSVNIDALNEILPMIEKALPFPEKYKRPNLDDPGALPNASINRAVFGTGGYGPLHIVAAYCLPNYQEIRANYGSKQIIYDTDGGLAKKLNPELYRRLFYTKEQADWLAEYDPEFKLLGDIWKLHCILHETLGHGSGRPDVHVFREGDPLSVGGKTYQVGDVIQVTHENENEFLGGYRSAFEELRAEILALYTSIYNFDQLKEKGLYGDWPEIIGKEKMIEWLITDMGFTGLRRLLSQPEGKEEISGAHAQANTTIMNYLIDEGGIEIERGAVNVEGQEHTVVGLHVKDKDRALSAIKKLAIFVQQLKSTADGQEVKKLIETFGKYVRHPKDVRYMKENLRTVLGELKVSAGIAPRLEPVLDKEGEVVEIDASWPESFIEQWQEYKKKAMSKEY